MKKMLALLVLSMVSICAMAEDVPFEYHVKSYGESGDKLKMNVSDVQKGVFIKVGHGIANLKYSKSTALIEAVFRRNGIKIASSPEEADFGFQIDWDNVDIPYAFWDKIEEDSGSSTQAAIVGKEVATNLVMIAALGPGVGSSVTGKAIDPSKPIPTTVSIAFAKNPKLNWMKMMSGDDFKKMNVTLVSQINRFDRNGDGFYAKILVAMIQNFVNAHFDGLPAPAAAPVAVPASAVAPATPVAAN